MALPPSASTDAFADWEQPTDCENEHPEPLPAVAIIHIIGSDSAANATALCAGCVVMFAEEWADEVQSRDPDAYRWEIRPVLPNETKVLSDD